MSRIRLASPLLFGLLLSAAVSAQTSTSQISGLVLDASGSAVPQATVTLINEATGVTQKSITSESGVYSFPSIPAGVYTIRVEAKGFKTAVRTGNTIQVNTPVDVDITLEIGATTESVQVSAASELLQTSNATLGNVVEQRSIVHSAPERPQSAQPAHVRTRRGAALRQHGQRQRRPLHAPST